MKTLFRLSMILTFVFLLLPANAQTYQMTIVSGNHQYVAKNNASEPLKVKVTNQDGSPVRTSVAFFAPSGHRMETTVVDTNSEGVASATFLAGGRTEIVKIHANVLNILNQTFTLRTVAPITNYLPGSPSTTSKVWKKYIGESAPADTPDLYDFSYVGYKEGSEGRPEIDELGYTVYNVTDYGAIPNDGLSDTQAIHDTLTAARGGNALILFPKGLFDVMMEGDSLNAFHVRGSNTLVAGAGGYGHTKGGTTIKQHLKMGNQWSWCLTLFTTAGRPYRDGYSGADYPLIVGNHERGVKSITVTQTHFLAGKKYIQLGANGLRGDDYLDHCSFVMAQNRIIGRNGIKIREFNEVDRIDGNVIHLKKPTITPLNPEKYFINYASLSENIGFQDLHIDNNFHEAYSHNSHDGRGGITLSGANPYIRRVRVSNTVVAFLARGAYSATISSVITDGNAGHYPGVVLNSSHTLVRFVEDNTSFGNNTNMGGHIHGISVASKVAGTVLTKIGGHAMHGPDAHGDQPRYTLFDNYHSRTHHRASGVWDRHPNHLNGFYRWNNRINESRTINYDTLNQEGGIWALIIPFPVLVGYRTLGGNTPRNAYVDGFRLFRSPISVYEAQLIRRLGYTPAWLDQTARDHEEFYRRTYSKKVNHSPDFPNDEKTVYIQESVAISSDITIVTATDADDDILTYSFVTGDHQKFSLNGSTGQITLTSALDYETDTSHTFTVRVSDGNMTDEISVKVQVSDVHERILVSDRTPVVRDAIRWTLENEHGVNFDVVETITASQLERIDDLYIFEETFSGFKDGDLQGLSGLEILYIEDNNLTDKTFPENLFSDLRSLEELVIYGNGLTSIAKRSFWNLENIKELLIGPNDLTEIDPELFIYCHGIEYISVSDTKIKTLPKDVFKGLTDLKVIGFSRNLLGKDNGNKKNALPTKLFDGLTSLENIYLEGNDLSADDFPNGTFIGLKNLETLWLGDPDPAITPTISFPVTIIKSSDNKIKAVLAVGAPFELELPIIITNGSATKSKLTIKKGETRSRALKIDSNGAALDTTISYGNLTKVTLPSKHFGYRFHKSGDLPLVVFNGIRPLAAPGSIPKTTELLANFPNPFNPETWIPYQLATPSDVSITIYNSRGVVVRDIKLGRQTAGYYTTRSRAAHWDGRNSTGERVATGMYFYQFKTDDMSELKKMIIMK